MQATLAAARLMMFSVGLFSALTSAAELLDDDDDSWSYFLMRWIISSASVMTCLSSSSWAPVSLMKRLICRTRTPFITRHCSPMVMGLLNTTLTPDDIYVKDFHRGLPENTFRWFTSASCITALLLSTTTSMVPIFMRNTSPYLYVNTRNKDQSYVQFDVINVLQNHHSVEHCRYREGLCITFHCYIWFDQTTSKILLFFAVTLVWYDFI